MARKQQVLLEGIDGKARVLVAPLDHSGALHGHSLYNAVHAATAGAYKSVQLLYNGRRVYKNSAFPAASLAQPAVVRAICGQLLGGKGGFGAQLKASAKNASASTQQDACRDLQGKRLRYANREKLLQEWQEDAPNRELERVAEEHAMHKKKAKQREAAEVAAARAKEEVENAFAANDSCIRDAVSAGLKRCHSASASGESSSDESTYATVKAPKKTHCVKRNGKEIALPGLDDDEGLSSDEEADDGDEH